MELQAKVYLLNEVDTKRMLHPRVYEYLLTLIQGDKNLLSMKLAALKLNKVVYMPRQWAESLVKAIDEQPRILSSVPNVPNSEGIVMTLEWVTMPIVIAEPQIIYFRRRTIKDLKKKLKGSFSFFWNKAVERQGSTFLVAQIKIVSEIESIDQDENFIQSLEEQEKDQERVISCQREIQGKEYWVRKHGEEFDMKRFFDFGVKMTVWRQLYSKGKIVRWICRPFSDKNQSLTGSILIGNKNELFFDMRPRDLDRAIKKMIRPKNRWFTDTEPPDIDFVIRFDCRVEMRIYISSYCEGQKFKEVHLSQCAAQVRNATMRDNFKRRYGVDP